MMLVIAFFFAWIAPASAQPFSRPTACDGCINYWYYLDQDASDGGQSDWNCGANSYDGHTGTDFSLDCGNDCIDTGYDILAAADGVVVSSEDGHFDRCETCDAGEDGRCGYAYGYGLANHVVIDHGTHRAFYGHMRRGSVRVTTGDSVRCGDVIGQIGSSGCSTGAHLHFEITARGTDTPSFDPYAGPCSPTATSTWTEQGPYLGMPTRDCGSSSTACSGDGVWTCNGALDQRSRCVGGVDMVEQCPSGCVVMPAGVDDVCMQASDGDGDGTAADLDCDDTDAGRHPGASEVCGDGVDQDCDGSDFECGGGDAGLSPRGTAFDEPGGSLTGGCSTAPIAGASSWLVLAMLCVRRLRTSRRRIAGARGHACRRRPRAPRPV
jgi:hypothetical protein